MINHRDTDTIDVIFTKEGDPDATVQIPLSRKEARVLANLLGAPYLVARLREEHRDLDGIETRQLPIRRGSPYLGRTLGETQMRTRTKASIVAVMRSGQIQPSPGPDFVFVRHDVLVVVGTVSGLDAASALLVDG